MSNDISHFKAKLETQKKALEQELKTVGHLKSILPGASTEDWEATQTAGGEDTADQTEVAETLTEYDTNSGILRQLETDLIETDKALDRIEKGTYGICEVCSKQIETTRLEANVAARTCIEHKEEVL